MNDLQCVFFTVSILYLKCSHLQCWTLHFTRYVASRCSSKPVSDRWGRMEPVDVRWFFSFTTTQNTTLLPLVAIYWHTWGRLLLLLWVSLDFTSWGYHLLFFLVCFSPFLYIYPSLSPVPHLSPCVFCCLILCLCCVYVIWWTGIVPIHCVSIMVNWFSVIQHFWCYTTEWRLSCPLLSTLFGYRRLGHYFEIVWNDAIN